MHWLCYVIAALLVGAMAYSLKLLGETTGFGTQMIFYGWAAGFLVGAVVLATFGRMAQLLEELVRQGRRAEDMAKGQVSQGETP